MGAISMVKENNTSGRRLMSNINIMNSQILVYWFLHFNSRINPFLFTLFNVNVQNIPEKVTLCPAVCSQHISSKCHMVWKSTCSWENIPCLRCLPFRVFYSVILQTIPVPPGACCCTPDALNAWRIMICLVDLSVLTCFFGDKNKKATGVVLSVRNTKTFCHGFSAAVYSERSLFFNWRLWKALEP